MVTLVLEEEEEGDAIKEVSKIEIVDFYSHHMTLNVKEILALGLFTAGMPPHVL